MPRDLLEEAPVKGDGDGASCAGRLLLKCGSAHVEGEREKNIWIEKIHGIHSAQISNCWPGQLEVPKQNVPIGGILDRAGRF